MAHQNYITEELINVQTASSSVTYHCVVHDKLIHKVSSVVLGKVEAKFKVRSLFLIKLDVAYFC